MVQYSPLPKENIHVATFFLENGAGQETLHLALDEATHYVWYKSGKNTKSDRENEEAIWNYKMDPTWADTTAAGIAYSELFRHICNEDLDDLPGRLSVEKVPVVLATSVNILADAYQFKIVQPEVYTQGDYYLYSIMIEVVKKICKICEKVKMDWTSIISQVIRTYNQQHQYLIKVSPHYFINNQKRVQVNMLVDEKQAKRETRQKYYKKIAFRKKES